MGQAPVSVYLIREVEASALIERDLRHGYVSSQAAAAPYGHTAKAAV